MTEMILLGLAWVAAGIFGWGYGKLYIHGPKAWDEITAGDVAAVVLGGGVQAIVALGHLMFVGSPTKGKLVLWRRKRP